MNESDILSIVKEIGNPYLIALIIVIATFATIFKSEVVAWVKVKMANRGVKKIKELVHHDVFPTLERATMEVKVMKFYTHKEYDKVKSKMCYDFTKNKSRVCKEYMMKLATNPDIDRMDANELKNFVIRYQNEMHRDYVSNVRELWLSKGIPEDDVQHVIHLFETFRYDVVASFSHRIESIFGSTFHRNNFEKVLAVYNMWAMGIDLLPRDMQVTFEGLNGKFKNIKY